MKAVAIKMIPKKVDVVAAITIENFAAFGRLAPSSLDTLTLIPEIQTCSFSMSQSIDLWH